MNNNSHNNNKNAVWLCTNHWKQHTIEKHVTTDKLRYYKFLSNNNELYIEKVNLSLVLSCYIYFLHANQLAQLALWKIV